LEHSKNLNNILNTRKERVCGSYIQEILPELYLEKMMNIFSEEFFFYNHENKQFKVIFKKLSILESTANVLYFTEDFIIKADEDEFFFIDPKDSKLEADDCEKGEKNVYDSDNIDEMSKKLGLKEKKSKLSSCASTSPVLSFQEIKCFKKSILLMNFSKVILLILVNIT